MRSTLAPVLSLDDLPAAELQAARLDGDVYPLAGAFCLIGELESPRHRARAVLAGRSPRLIAELGTAAWIWGAVDDLGRLRFAVSPDSRTRLPLDAGHVVREIVHAAGDVVELDGFRVTTPLRTILDLARADDPGLDPALARLAEIGGLSHDDCRASLESRSGIPGKAAVADRLDRALATTR